MGPGSCTHDPTEAIQMITDEQAEDIVLTARLFGINTVDAAYIVFDRLGLKLDMTDFDQTISLLIQIEEAKKRLGEITKKTQS
jgi:hypothetical protein